MVLKTNVNSFYDILKIAKRDSSALIYASSAATYGSLPSPQTIGTENPENPYGYSKYVMDQIAMRFANQNPNISVVGLRFFNVYGNREYYKAKTSSMVIQLGHQILSKKAPRLFSGSEKIFRDFIFIDDVIQSNIKSCRPNQSGVFNIGTGNPRSFQDIADILQQELKTNLGTEYFENPYQGYQMHTQADISESISGIDFDPIFSLEDGIRHYIPEIIKFHNLPTD